jgi:hypothetical protein
VRNVLGLIREGLLALVNVQGRRDGRLIVLTALTCYFGLVLVVSIATDDFDMWRYLGVLHISGPFEDMRVITSGWECTRKGFDVLVENPCDPFRRELNYPRIWTAPAPLGLGQESTVALSIAAWILFYGAVLLLVGRLTRGEAVFYAAILLSPSVMLGVASGNNDLLVFAVLVLGIITLRARRVLLRSVSYGLFLLAAVLKLYPVFAFAALIRQDRRAAAAALAVTVVPFAVYVAVTADDLRLISKATPRPTLIAYGAGVFLDGLGKRLGGTFEADVVHQQPGRAILFTLFIVAALAASIWLAGRLRPPPGRDTVVGLTREMDAFCVGAAIYLGTFVVVGYNWDYRLLFLLLTVPQLLVWVRGSGPLATAAALALLGVAGTMWVSRLPFIFPLDDLLNWLLCVYFAAALSLTLPSWLARMAGYRPLGRRPPERADHAE